VKHNVPITENLAEKLSPLKRKLNFKLINTKLTSNFGFILKKASNDAELPNYYSTLEMIGDAAFDQRLYTIAAKKYTEANNRIKASFLKQYFFKIMILFLIFLEKFQGNESSYEVR
jgi:hypothetical protein